VFAVVAAPAPAGSAARWPARPRVSTPLPGPRSAERLSGGVNAHSARQFPFVVAEASGSYLRDLDGNVFLDFLAGAGVVPSGAAGVAAPGPAMGRDDVMDNVVARGEQIADRLAGLAHHPAVHQVRGTGLMWGIELNAPGDGRSVTELAADIRSRALRSGLVVELGGPDDRVLRMLPALDVTAEVVDIALSILLHAIEGAYVGASQVA
jgi:4-aminobutyrate aminotransferase-like enzyme